MKVWILKGFIDFESYDILGVFSTDAGARHAAAREAHGAIAWNQSGIGSPVYPGRSPEYGSFRINSFEVEN